ncbi:hypothetical protein EK904_010594 [Melospiza melodia maxima]|nr:hypothetical protein EK904_010594 [Melospiza melodia maxima]
MASTKSHKSEMLKCGERRRITEREVFEQEPLLPSGKQLSNAQRVNELGFGKQFCGREESLEARDGVRAVLAVTGVLQNVLSLQTFSSPGSRDAPQEALDGIGDEKLWVLITVLTVPGPWNNEYLDQV